MHPAPSPLALLAALFGPSLASGCGAIAILEEGAGGAGGAGATSTTSTTKGSTSVVSSTSKSGSAQTGMPDPCQTPLGEPCDVAMFPSCEPVMVSGIPCCYLTKSCDAAAVVWGPAACTDDCPQSCELVTNPEHCEALGWCVLGPGGCASLPPP